MKIRAGAEARIDFGFTRRLSAALPRYFHRTSRSRKFPEPLESLPLPTIMESASTVFRTGAQDRWFGPDKSTAHGQTA